MKQGKRIKRAFPAEYRLLIDQKRKEREQTTVTRAALRTVNEFTNFRYEIVVEPVLEGKTIRLSIHGLRAPQVTIPGTGPAVFETEFEGLRGTYTVVVSKLDREENQFTISISAESVTLKSPAGGGFVDLVTNVQEW